MSSPDFRRRAENNPAGRFFARKYAEKLFRMAGGFIHTQVFLTCVRLDLFERLAGGPQPVTSLASELGMDASRLRHLLSAAAALDLVSRRSKDRFGLGPLGASMVGNEAVKAFVLHHADFYEDLDQPETFFRGEKASKLANLWTYAGGTEDCPDAAAAYSNLMQQSQEMVADQVLRAFSFEGVGSLVDIGGGTGEFACRAAERWPELAVTIADLPPVADIARARLDSLSMERRVDVVGLDVTTQPIPGSYDVASLVRIVHDHNDDKALQILMAARDALAPGGRLVIAEPLASKSPAGRLNDTYFQVYLLAMGSGRPRRFSELKALIRAAGFSKVRKCRSTVPLIADVVVAEL